MKIQNVLLGLIVAAAAAAGTVGVVPTANAASFHTSCVPAGGGMARCTQTFCHEGACVVTDTWTQPMREVIEFQ
ncbi:MULTISPECIES: hypothetical protein [Stenotrophomonas]|jgi:enhancing lycopene biosynthesis protein 2|uniref:hypothetical protein n=1 Tax=Stenotrophomonas TaxID=40323 RepID=UPI00129CC60A|nr:MULTISPECIES: hypothetical protein [Stenotrophomonas]UQA70043.1 hypothetical protein K1516_19265 [Stenotrophomonas maltophilia]HEL4101785.1 hypothetical protein [Stenotrophomonas maltophilia]